MSDLLNIGASGLAAYRNALAAVGDNVANAQTPGYSRRRIVLAEATATGTTDIAYRPQVTFNGVTTLGVIRAWDAFKATEARLATSAASRASVRQQWLGSVEAALDDSAAGVGSSMTGFFTAAASLAADPGDPLGRRLVLSALDNAAGAFRRTAGALERISTGIADSARMEVTALNDALAALHNLNGALASASATGSARASLEDQRDRLIESVASRIDVDVSFDNEGRALLVAAGDASQSLVRASGPSLIVLNVAADGRLSPQLSANGAIVPLAANGGTIAGLTEIAQTVADRRASLDAMAVDFAGLVNGWSAGGIDGTGAVGGPLVDATGGAIAMQAPVDDPARVPAAGGGAPNGNLLALDALRTASGIEGRWTQLVSANAQMLSSARAQASAASAWRDVSYASLDEVAGIDLDTEAADLLRYQQAYNASARIIQVARETIQALFDAL